MNALGKTERFATTPYLGISVGSSLLAARLGLTGYQTALDRLKQLTLGRTVSLVRQASGLKHQILATTASSLDESHDNRISLDHVFRANKVRRKTVWSILSDSSRTWILPLGHVGSHDYSIAIQTHPDAPETLFHDIGKEVFQCWQLGDATAAAPREQYSPPVPVDVLGPDNPFGLTKAERLVCENLRSRARPKAIAQNIGVSIATIRTHLARIYSKTDCAGMVEVLHLLGTAPRHTAAGVDNAT